MPDETKVQIRSNMGVSQLISYQNIWQQQVAFTQFVI